MQTNGSLFSGSRGGGGPASRQPLNTAGDLMSSESGSVLANSEDEEDIDSQKVKEQSSSQIVD